MDFIYYACDYEDKSPISSSNTLEGLLEAVDYFMGAHETYNFCGKRLSYEPYYSKYPSDFEGIISYEVDKIIQKVAVYTIDFKNK
jgi:hypothetical protein